MCHTRQGRRQELSAIKHGLSVKEISEHHTDKGRHKGLTLAGGRRGTMQTLLMFYYSKEEIFLFRKDFASSPGTSNP